jgi:hypothetical protein
MSYLDQSEIADSESMGARVAQCVASEGGDNPDTWTQANRREWASAPGWDAAWASAQAGHPDDPSYDPGADEAVITDAMILGQIQTMDPPAKGGDR